MTRYYRRRRPGREENLKAAALGLGAGVVVAAGAFYLARLFLGREVLGTPSGPGNPGGGGVGRAESRHGPESGEVSRTRTGSPVRADLHGEAARRSSGP